MNQLKHKKFLIAPLDWGLGHATRCIPIINYLLQQNAKVVIAGNGNALAFLIDQFPQLKYYTLASYNIQYLPNKNAAVQSLLQLPNIRKAILKEHQQVKTIIQEQNIDIIISDNRYGVYNKNCTNVFICHQIALQAPKPFEVMNFFFLKLHLQFIKKFNYLFIPDFSSHNNLSGILSHNIKFPIPHFYIGLLSRFTTPIQINFTTLKQYQIVVLLSGVEPQRTHFEQEIIQQLKQLDKSCLIIRGVKKDASVKTLTKFIDVVDFVHHEALFHYLNTTEIVICRSGYSTVMDLAVLGKKAIYIPTKGQTEQEYLAKRLEQLQLGVVQEQHQLNIAEAIDQLNKIRPYKPFRTNFKLLAEALEQIV